MRYIVLLCLVTVGLTAAGGSQSAPASPVAAGGAPQAESAKNFTFVGCLVEAEGSGWRFRSPERTALGVSGGAREFGLKHVVPASDKDASANSERELALRSDSVNLGDHINRQVEVTGHFMVDDGQPANTERTTRLRTLNEGGNDFQVTAVRMIGDCPS